MVEEKHSTLKKAFPAITKRRALSNHEYVGIPTLEFEMGNEDGFSTCSGFRGAPLAT